MPQNVNTKLLNQFRQWKNILSKSFHIFFNLSVLLHWWCNNRTKLVTQPNKLMSQQKLPVNIKSCRLTNRWGRRDKGNQPRGIDLDKGMGPPPSGSDLEDTLNGAALSWGTGSFAIFYPNYSIIQKKYYSVFLISLGKIS